jgi:murein DD-endopeptidase MepM/ murein hydrolase activator NlpD
MKRSLFLLICACLLAACQGPASQATPALAAATPLATLTVSIPATETMLATPNPTVGLTASPSAQPLQTCAESEPVCILAGHFLMQRPIELPNNIVPDHTYLYGSTQSGKREPHHGVEFPNAQGTPVLAVADGKVVFAGDDKLVLLAWMTTYYGNVVVVQHDFPGPGGPIYSLYAHLYKINVSQGQQVRLGEQIGQVGATGRAIGSHLHFEVRAVNNDYRSNRNPELWLAPLAGTGVLAGRIEDAQGKLVKGVLNVQRMDAGVLNPLPVTSIETYVINEPQPVNGDDIWHENFTAGDLPAGDYRLSMLYDGALSEMQVKIEPDKLTFVRFILK